MGLVLRASYGRQPRTYDAVLVAVRVTRRLAARHLPISVAFDIPRLAERAARVELELGAHAAVDRDRCRGYFPALRGVRRIDGDLPACRAFATSFPFIRHAGVEHRFNFLRLSLTPQSADPAYHLDSDTATALTGDVTTLRHRRVARLLVNLSSQCVRTLHYLDVDPSHVDLIADGSYIRAADPRGLAEYALMAAIPPRRGCHVSGLVFTANLVLHSGRDDAGGHFVAAHGIDAMDDGAPTA